MSHKYCNGVTICLVTECFSRRKLNKQKYTMHTRKTTIILKLSGIEPREITPALSVRVQQFIVSSLTVHASEIMRYLSLSVNYDFKSMGAYTMPHSWTFVYVGP